jgi:starch synthase
MSKSLSVLYVATEVFPFAKETDVADIAGGFPLALHEIGPDTRIIMPRYSCMSDRKHKIHGINRMSELKIEMPDGKKEYMTLKSASIANTKSKVQVYAVCNKKYFETKKGIYHDPVK